MCQGVRPVIGHDTANTSYRDRVEAAGDNRSEGDATTNVCTISSDEESR
jgi:hypothetical protein